MVAVLKAMRRFQRCSNARTPIRRRIFFEAKACSHARACERAGDPLEFFPALFGLWIVYLLRRELRRAYALAEHLLRLAQSADDPALPLYARSALGNTSF
jgi:hypothetical protein